MNRSGTAQEFIKRVKLNTGFALTWQWVFTGLKADALSCTSTLFKRAKSHNLHHRLFYLIWKNTPGFWRRVTQTSHVQKYPSTKQ